MILLSTSGEVFSTRYPRNAPCIGGEKGSSNPSTSVTLSFVKRNTAYERAKEKQHVVIGNTNASQHHQTSTDLRHTTGHSAGSACLNPFFGQCAPWRGRAKPRPYALAHRILSWYDDHVGHSSCWTLRLIHMIWLLSLRPGRMLLS